MNELQELKGVLFCPFFRSQSTGGNSSSGGGSNAANSTNSSSSSGHGSGHHHDASGSIAAVQSTLERLSSQRDELGELWAARKRRLDLCLRLRLFERDALELSSQYELWAERLQAAEVPRGDLKEAEQQLRWGKSKPFRA